MQGKYNKAWLVTLVGSLFFFYVFIQMSMFNALSPYLSTVFAVSTAKITLLSAMYFYMNVLFLFPAGMLLDRVSTRKVMLVCTTIIALATLGLAFTSVYWQALCLRMLVGIAGSFSMLSCIRLATRWFPPQKMAFVIGMITLIALSGGVIAQAPFTWLTDHLGWRQAVYTDAGLGLFIALAVFIVVRDRPAGTEVETKPAAIEKIPFWTAITRVARNRENWLAGLYICLMNIPVLVFLMWGSFYLTQNWHLSREGASIIDMSLMIGAILGAPALGQLSDLMQSRRRPMIWCAVAATLLTVPLLFAGHLSVMTLLAVFAAIGFISSGQIIGYPHITASNPSSLAATASGLASVLIMAGGSAQQLFGYVLDHFGHHTMLHHVAQYSTTSYHAAILLIPIGSVLALFMAIAMREPDTGMAGGSLYRWLRNKLLGAGSNA